MCVLFLTHHHKTDLLNTFFSNNLLNPHQSAYISTTAL